jgi:FkbM family methyltransferase
MLASTSTTIATCIQIHVGFTQRGYMRLPSPQEMSRLRALLDPPRLRDAVRRRRFARVMAQVPLLPYAGLVALGTEYGGWVVPAELIDAQWTCWCVGAGSDVSFDVRLLALGARVRSFDPFELFKRQAEAEAGNSERYSFHVCAIAPEDGPVTMYGRQDEEAGSVSGVNLYHVDTAFEKEGRSLHSLKEELGDERIDLLKLDVEGMEYDLLETLDPSELGVRILCIEFHPSDDAGPERAMAAIERLRTQGYEPVNAQDGTDFTFVSRSLVGDRQPATAS